MTALNPVLRVLVVSQSDKVKDFLCDVLPSREYDIVASVKNAGEANRLLSSVDFDIAVVNAPLSDELGTELALNLAEKNVGVLALAKNEFFDAFCEKTEEAGVFTLQKPTTPSNVYGAIKLLTAMRLRLARMERKNRTLQEKMTDIRLVNKAKWLLIENRGVTESEAHYYIEKQAMDQRVSAREIAERIIKDYEK